MKPIEIDNKKLHDLIVQKDELVDVGRDISKDIEKKEKEIVKYQNEEKLITGKVKADAVLQKEGDALVLQLDVIIKRLDEIGKAVEKEKMKAIPDALLAKHKTALKEKEQMERERNKVALKIQKIKDKVIPMVKTIVKPLLNEYDDTETVKTKNGKVIITTFNYLEDFKAKFKK